MNQQITLRRGVLEDAAVLTQFYLRAWRMSYVGVLSEQALSSLNEKDVGQYFRLILKKNPDLVFLAESVSRHPVGLAVIRPQPLYAGSRGAEPRPDFDLEQLSRYKWELHSIYIEASQIRRGIGRELLHEVFRAIINRNENKLLVWVLKANTRACAFYESQGAHELCFREIEIGEQTYVECAYVWELNG